MNRTFYNLLRRKPFLLLLALIGLARGIAAFLPFRVWGLADGLETTNLLPFTYLSLGALFLNHPNPQDQVPFDITVMMTDFLFWIAVGYLLRLCYRLYWEHKPAGKKLLFGLPPLYFGFLELAQLWIDGQITDVNDIISGCGGVYAGYLTYILLRKARRKTYRTPTDLLKIPLIIYGIFLLFSALRPFDWLFHPQVSASDWGIESLIPLYGYFNHGSPMISEFLKSLTHFLPISSYWSYKLRGSGKPYPYIYVNTIITGLFLGMFIEIIQLFSATRITHITDPLGWAFSGALGTALIYYYEYHTFPALKRARKHTSASSPEDDPLSRRQKTPDIQQVEGADDEEGESRTRE